MGAPSCYCHAKEAKTPFCHFEMILTWALTSSRGSCKNIWKKRFVAIFSFASYKVRRPLQDSWQDRL